MTANELANEFEIGYDIITSLGAPGYTDEEISTILSIGQENLIKKKYTPDGNKYRKGFEGSEKRRKDLSELVRTVVLNNSNISASQIGTYPNGTFYDLPADIMYAISEHAISTIPLCDKGVIIPGKFKQVDIIPKTHDEYNIDIHNPFKNPNEDEIWRIDYSSDVEKRHELIKGENYDVSSYFIRYIKKPLDIVVDRLVPANQVASELDSSVHREIIQEAIRYAVSITDPQKYQLKTVEQQQSE